MTITKTQLRRLIQEVLREADAALDPKANATATAGQPLPNTAKFKEEKKPTVIKLKVAGLKDAQIKKILAKLSYQAMKNDLSVIHAEIEKEDGGKVTGLSPVELQAQAAQLGKPELAGGEGEDEEGEMPPIHKWKKMSPEEREKYIKPGAGEEEWKQLTAKDTENERKKLAKRKELSDKGQLAWNDEENRPEDTELWTDKDWDFWNKGEPTPENIAKYKPTLSKGTAHVKKGAVSADFSNKLRH